MIKWLGAALISSAMAVSSSASANTIDIILPFDATLGETPESIAIDKHENIYLTMSNTVRRITAQGEMSVHGTLPIGAFALGVKVGPDNCVYTASTSLDPSLQGAFVWRICQNGQIAEQYAELDHSGGPNDLAFDDNGNLFVTDPQLGKVYKIDSCGQVSTWASGTLLQGNPGNPALFFSPLGADGIAFDKNQQNLYVTNLDYGQIIKIPVKSNGTAGTPEVYVSSPLLVGADGIAFDTRGDLWVAVGTQDQIVHVSKHKVISVVAQGGVLAGPASLAFGTKGADKKTLYIAGLDFLRAFGFIAETPNPALLSTQGNVPGLKLP